MAFKSLVYAATLSAAGGVFFCLYTRSHISPEAYRRIRPFIRRAVWLALIGTAMRVAIVAGSMGEGVRGLLDVGQVSMVLQAGEARASGLRMAGLLMIATLPIARPWSRWGGIAALAGAVFAATSFAWIGHAWGARNGGLSVVLLGLHLVCIAFWLGALGSLMPIARGGDRDELERAVRRFANMAVAAVVVLVLAGTLLLVTLLHGFADLWTTEYGRFVTLKIALVALLIGVAAFNRYVLTPRLTPGLTGRFASRERAAVSLHRSIVVEVGLAAVILLVTATFTTLVGPE